MDHTEACTAARAGHHIEDKNGWGVVIDVREDPYPTMHNLTAEQRADVLACPHRDHDVVRVYCQVDLP